MEGVSKPVTCKIRILPSVSTEQQPSLSFSPVPQDLSFVTSPLPSPSIFLPPPQLEETLELVKLIESTGVAAVAVHGRYNPRDNFGHLCGANSL